MARTDAITFDTEKRLDELAFFASGDGRPHRWSVMDSDAGRGLAGFSPPIQIEIAWRLRLPSARRRTRRLRVNALHDQLQQVDRAAGVFVRFRSPDDYYAVRASALENNVSLCRIAAGRRESEPEAWTSTGRARRGIRSASRPAAASGIFRRQGAFCRDRQKASGPSQARSACGPRPTA